MPRVPGNILVYDSEELDFRWDLVVVAQDEESLARRLRLRQRLDVFTLTTNAPVPKDETLASGADCLDPSDVHWTWKTLRDTLVDAAVARRPEATRKGFDGNNQPPVASPPPFSVEATDGWVWAGGSAATDPLDPCVKGGNEPFELKFDVASGPGRWLVIGIVVLSDGELDLECWATGPRTSWLDDLPAVFRENPIAAAFLERLLASFKVEWDGIAKQIATFERYLDPTQAPSVDALRFLAGWFGIELPRAGAGLGLAKQRRYIDAVLPLHTCRGTPAALEAWAAAWLHLRGVDTAGGRLPRIVEGFRIRRCLRPATDTMSGSGADLEKAAPLGPEAFAGGARLDVGHRLGEVRLPPRDDLVDWEAAVDRTLWVFRPSFAENTEETKNQFLKLLDGLVPAGLEIIDRPVGPPVYLGHDSLLGLNTALGRGR
jgi:phage tail-like protein